MNTSERVRLACFFGNLSSQQEDWQKRLGEKALEYPGLYRDNLFLQLRKSLDAVIQDAEKLSLYIGTDTAENWRESDV